MNYRMLEMILPFALVLAILFRELWQLRKMKAADLAKTPPSASDNQFGGPPHNNSSSTQF